jgi:glycosyltransferase involved in cell wall biosynthesis
MRIAYDHQIFGWQRFGGISRYIFEVANHLAEAEGNSIDCHIVSPLHVNDYLRRASSKLKVTGIHAPAVRKTGRLYRFVNKTLAPSILRTWRPDILHETYYSKNAIAPRGCKTVLTVHDMIHELYPQYFASWDPTREEKSKAVARADHIICVSENTRRDLMRLLDVPGEKISVVHHGFALAPGETADLPLPRRPFFLFVGSRGGYKNFDLLLEAYAEKPNIKDNYDLIAFGGGSFNTHEKELIHRLGLTELQVRQFGGDDSILGPLYKQASFFVYPSLYEGFGIPPLEAMNFECPVVCSNTSSIPEVVGDAAFLFDPHDAISIANAIETVAGDPSLQADLKRRGKDRLNSFSWRRCAAETLAVYSKVLK